MDVRRAIFAALLGQFPPGRLLDLACGHGRFSLLAQQAGWKVTGVDVRTERWPDVAGIDWVESDVRSYEVGDDHDCIAILGLLYHLELDDQIALLRRCAHRPTIVDTHVSVRAKTIVDGYEGHVFDEGDLTAATASWGNAASFWPTEAGLVRMFYEAGYASVYKHVPSYRPDRTFWLCLPSTGEPQLERWREDSQRAMSGTEKDVRQELVHARAELVRARAGAEAYQAAYERLAAHPVVRSLRAMKGLARRRSPARRPNGETTGH